MAALRALALLLAALALGGCGERGEPLGELPAYPATVEGAGDEPTVVEVAPQRIAALTPAAAELVVALGAGGQLVGVPSGLDLPEAAGAARVVRPSGRVDADAVRTSPRPRDRLARRGPRRARRRRGGSRDLSHRFDD